MAERERDGDIEATEEAMTGGSKTAVLFVRLSVSWEANKPTDAHVLSLSLITIDIYTEGQKCRMSQHFHCCHILASLKAVLH